jgi:hypothetical protein
MTTIFQNVWTVLDESSNTHSLTMIALCPTQCGVARSHRAGAFDPWGAQELCVTFYKMNAIDHNSTFLRSKMLHSALLRVSGLIVVPDTPIIFDNGRRTP